MTFQTLTGIQYLQAEIACKHNKSLEKAIWDDRVHAFWQLDLNDPKTFLNASNPIGMRAAYVAYQDVLSKKPVGYMISLDASSSGLQLLSLLVSCPTSFMLCGGTHDRCVDSYMEIYNSLGLKKLSRKEVKSAIMTALYGSTSIPFHTFKENVDLFYDTMAEMVPGAWQLNLDLQGLWERVKGHEYDWILPDNFHAMIETEVPDQQGFRFLDHDRFITKYVPGRPDFHKGLGPNLIHSVDGMVVREMARRCMYNPDRIIQILELIQSKKIHGTGGKSGPMVQLLWSHFKQSGFLTTRIFDYLYEDTMGYVDADHILDLIASLPEKPFQIVTNHDCFRCHPNYGNDLRKQYNLILADINESNMLQFLASQIAKKPLKTRKYGVIPREMITHANYTLA